MPSIARLYFKTAVLFLIAGIAVGIHMAISGEHSVMGAHAHANLLGWVTMALFGVYYALNPAQASTRLAKVQYGVYTLGVAVMVPALYVMLGGRPEVEPIVAAASLVVFAGVLLFAAVLFRRPAPAPAPVT